MEVQQFTNIEFKTLDQIECEHIKYVLDAHRFSIVASSKVLGITRATLCRKMKKYGIKK